MSIFRVAEQGLSWDRFGSELRGAGGKARWVPLQRVVRRGGAL